MTDASTPASQDAVVFLCYGGVARRLETLRAMLEAAYPRAQYVTAGTLDELRLVLGNIDPSVCFADLQDPPDAVDAFLHTIATDFGGLEVILLMHPQDEGDAPVALPEGATDFVLFRDDPAGRETLKQRVGCAVRRRAFRLAHERRLKTEVLAGTKRDLHGTLTRINHELNNPLAIISGNAQLFLELAEVEGLAPDFVDPVRDIDEAAQRLARSIRKLVELRDTFGPTDP